MTKDAIEAAERLKHNLQDCDFIEDLTYTEQDALTVARAYLSAQGEDGWQPIETAPKGKTMVALLHLKGTYARYGVGWYMPLSGWQGWAVDVAPTHWRPLPPPHPPPEKGNR